MTVLSISSNLLERYALYNGYALPQESDLVFFGIRGTLPDVDQRVGFTTERSIRFTAIDHKNLRCTIGQWRRSDKTIAIFPGSTVPSLPNIVNAKRRGGLGTNLLLPGRYEYVIGKHKSGKPGEHDAFRQAIFFPVRRTANNETFDNFDRIDFGSGPDALVADNLHASYSDRPDTMFSSAGCQVVCGFPPSARRGTQAETGAWRDFKQYAYKSGQNRFVYLLIPAAELGLLATGDDETIRQIVRYGSSGEAAKIVQQALIAKNVLNPPADGRFGRNSLMALTSFQTTALGPEGVDGICGTGTAAALKIALPTLISAKTPQSEQPQPGPIPPVEELPDETDMTRAELARILEAIGIALPGFPPSPVAASSGFSRKAFFDAIRVSLFEGTLRDSQVKGMEDVLDVWDRIEANSDPRWLAYTFASIFHETRRLMVPLREGFTNSDNASREAVRNLFLRGKIRRDYAIPVGDISYFGRGRVQTTHLDNYRRLSRRFNRDFVSEPNLLLDSRIDAEVAVIGHIEGLWTGKKLADYISGQRCDYGGARRIVNVQDKKDLIAGYAVKFERAVRAALAAGETEALPIPRAPSPAPHAPPRENRPMNPDLEAMNVRLERIEELLERLPQMPGYDGPAVGPVPDVTPEPALDDASQTERLKAIQDFIDSIRTKRGGGLTPVNGALGETIGKTLDGKKSAIGIIGAILTSIVGQSGDASVLGKAVGAATQAMPMFAGMSGPLMPIFLGLTAWGALGKLDKWRRLRGQP